MTTPAVQTDVTFTARRTRARFAILTVITVATAINYLDRSNLAIVGPDVQSALHLNAATMGIIFSAFGWTYAALQVPGGWMLDRVGAKLAFGVALVGWSIITGVQGLARSFGTLLGLRLALGVCEAPAFPSNNPLVSAWFPTRERGMATGVYTAGEYVGLAFAAPLLAYMSTRFGWPSVFYLTGCLGVAWAIVWFARIRNTPQEDRKASPSEREYIERGGGVVRPQTAPRVRLGDIPGLLRYRRIWGLLIGQFANTSTLFFFLTWFPTYLVKAKGFTLLHAGFYASIPYIMGLFGALFGGNASDWMLRRGVPTDFARKSPVIGGLILSMIIIGANYVSNAAIVILIMSVAFFAQGMASGTSWALVSDIAPAGKIGLTGGLFNFAANLGGTSSPLAIGFIVSATGSFVWGLGFITILAGIGAVAYIVLVDRVQRLATE